MRNHKYRGKSIEEGNLVYGWGCFTNESSKKYILISENNWIEVEEIQDSTNLHDKHGKEIWEGDVVKQYEGYKSDVFFRNGSFQTYIDNGMSLEISQNSLFDYFEVIGNIYSNPELLNHDK